MLYCSHIIWYIPKLSNFQKSKNGKMNAELLFKYFPELTELQKDQLTQLGPFYKEWNQRVNVVSRKDIEALYLHHVLHSLSIQKFMPFNPGTQLLDLGTGGGFPGIPLAILNPDCQFLLIDGKAKKISVVNAIIDALGLLNVRGLHKRSEELKMKFDFVLARAVTRLKPLLDISLHLISDKHINKLPNGIIALKGGDLKEEIREVQKYHQVEQTPVNKFFDEEYFNEKYILYIQG